MTSGAVEERLTGGESVVEAQARASRTSQDQNAKAARIARGANTPPAIPVASRSADGTRRVIMVRPTSRQDSLYYSARRDVAAILSAATHP